MMNFEIIKQNLITILGDDAAGNFKVVGYQQQNKDASEVAGNSRRVQVFSQESDIPEGRSGLTGPFDTETTYAVELTVSAKAKADLATINNPGSTAEQITAAMVALEIPAGIVDAQFDELLRLVMQILLDGKNVDIGTAKPFPVSGRWIPKWKKDQLKEQGDHVALTGRIFYRCLITEQVGGLVGIPAVAPAFNIETTNLAPDDAGDDQSKQGVKI